MLTEIPATSNGRQVRIYSKSPCTACDNTKRWLDRRGVPYAELDITTPENMELALSFGISAAPMVVVQPAGAPFGESEIIFSGFRPDVLLREFPAAEFPIDPEPEEASEPEPEPETAPEEAPAPADTPTEADTSADTPADATVPDDVPAEESAPEADIPSDTPEEAPADAPDPTEADTPADTPADASADIPADIPADEESAA